jgi:hypothetical protein
MRACAEGRAQRDRHPQHRPGRRHRAEPAPGEPGKRAFDVFTDCFKQGVLIRVTGDIIALSPPLIVQREQIDQIVDTLRTALKRVACACPCACWRPTRSSPGTRTTPPRRSAGRASRRWPATRCDVAIVGGGLAGLSAALELASAACSVVLLEARELGWGASGRNGGQAIHGLACDQDVIEQQLGLDDARRCGTCRSRRWTCCASASRRTTSTATGATATWAWPPTRARAPTWRLGRPHRAGLRLPADSASRPADCRAWIASPRFHSGVHDPRSGHLHPLKYTLGLARAAAAAGVQLHEHTPVTALRPGRRAAAAHRHRQVTARQVLLAGNVYLHGMAPALEPRIMPVGTYIACSEAAGPGTGRLA